MTLEMYAPLCIVLALSAGTAVHGGRVDAELAQASAVAAESEDGSAVVSVRITDQDGEVEFEEETLTWGSSAELVANSDGKEHRVSLKIDRVSDDKLAALLGYKRDGAVVVKSTKIEGQPAAPLTAKSKDGKILVSVVVTKKPSKKLDTPDVDPNDPLAGI